MILRYGNWVHIGVLLLTAGIVAGLYFLLKSFPQKAQKWTLFALTLVNVLQHLFKFWVWPHMWGGGFSLQNTAYNMCATLILLSPILFFTKGAFRDFITYLGTAAGAIVLLVPYWFNGKDILFNGQGTLNWEWMRSYTCHVLLLITSLLPVLLGLHKLKWKHFWKHGLFFLLLLVTVFLNNAVYYLVCEGGGLGEVYARIYRDNPVWMCHPNAGFAPLNTLLHILSPFAWLRDGAGRYIPILWYMLPLYGGITLIGFGVGILVDLSGWKAVREGIKRRMTSCKKEK